MRNRPLYSIGIVSDLLDVHPETIRTWESSGIVQPPQRRSGKRFYSENDLKRLQFIQRLVGEGLTVRAIRYYLRLYPCWQTEDCNGRIHSSDQIYGTKPCWQEPSAYCAVTSSQNPCANCQQREQPEAAETKPDIERREQDYHKSRSDFKSEVRHGS